MPVATISLSESGGEPRLPARTHPIDIGGNTFADRWGGAVRWEKRRPVLRPPGQHLDGMLHTVRHDPPAFNAESYPHPTIVLWLR